MQADIDEEMLASTSDDDIMASANPDDVDDICDMVFHFQDQDGPLDVLWKLVRSTKLDIKDVKLADITEQYLQYVKNMNGVDMDTMSWFVREASALLEIKSKSMLPKEKVETDEEVLDDEEMYKRRMELYRIFKESSVELATIENVDRFYKTPDESVGDYRIILKDMTMQNLIEAFSKILVKIDQKQRPQITERKIQKDRYTVKDRMDALCDVLNKDKVVRFKDMFKGDFTRGEIINTFLALLELLKRQVASVNQNDIFGDIVIQKKEGIEVRIEDGELNEYN
ncbi:MAG: segregation/condensation protein A [Clostridia bacterium]|nr:segregation/condensation protein A [Clostridia bacterium]